MLETFVTKGPLLAFTPISKNIQIKIIKIGVKYLPSISITEVDLKENKNTKIKYIIEKIIKLLKLNISKLTAQVLGIAIKGPKHANINILNIYSSINDVESGLSKIEGYINDKFDGVDKNDEVLFKVAMTYLDNKNYPIALKYFRMVNEKKIEDEKLKRIKGGFSVWAFVGITAIVAFLVGVVEGYTNPKGCEVNN